MKKVFKLKINLIGNNEAKPIMLKVKKYLEDNYYNVVNFCHYANYVFDAILFSKIIKLTNKHYIGFLFCNNAENLAATIDQDVIYTVVKKNNYLKKSTYNSSNILIFSLNKFDYDDIIKAINFYLNLFTENNELFF